MARRRRPPRPGALADLAPLRILTQIIVLQFCYYGFALIFIVFTTMVAGRHPDAGLLLDWHNLRGDVVTGWTLGLCWMLDSLMTVIPILLFIARSKLVPDFALTIHFIHLLVTSVYTRAIPSNFYWWLIQLSSAALMVFLGMWACQWRELKPMAFGGRGKSETNGKSKNDTRTAADDEDGVGFLMGGGRGKGKGKDGAGNYEMVGMAPREET